MANEWEQLAQGIERGVSIGLAMRQMKMQEQQAQQAEQRATEDRDFRQKEYQDRKSYNLAQIEIQQAQMFANAGLPDRALEKINPALERLGLAKWDVWPERGKEYFKVLGEAIALGKKSGNWKEARTTITEYLTKAGEEGSLMAEEFAPAMATAESILKTPGAESIGLMKEQLDFINEPGISPDEKARRERLVGIREKIGDPSSRKGATSFGGVDAEKADILFKSGAFPSQAKALMWLEDRKGMNESSMRLELFKHFTNPLMNKSPEEALKMAEENTAKLMQTMPEPDNEDANIQSAVDREILEAVDKKGTYFQIEEYLRSVGRDPAKYLEKHKDYRPPVLKQGR